MRAPRIPVLIILILLLALVARLVGINWGLPAVYHVDESSLVRAALGMRFGDLNPHFFDWPSLYKYLCYFLFAAFIKLRVPFQVRFGVETMRQALPFWWGSTAPFYLLTRLLTLFFDLGSVGLVYIIGKKLADRRAGLLAALIMAASFTNVHGTQYSRLDVPTVFFVLVSFYFVILLFEGGRWRDYLLAGFFAGLAASTKYNGAVIVVAIAAAHFLRVWRGWGVKRLRAAGRDFGQLLSAGGASVFGFLIGTPYALLDFPTFLGSKATHGSFLWQMGSTGHGANWCNFVTGCLLQDWGIPMGLLFLAGAVWAVVRHSRKDILLLSFPLAYFVYAGSWGIVRCHYILLLYPFLAMLSARLVLSFLGPRFGRAITAALVIVCLVHPFSRIVKGDISGFRGDTRNLAYDWVLANIPFGTSIAVDGRALPSYLGGRLPILPRAEDTPRGYFLYPWEEVMLDCGQDWGRMSLEFERKNVEFYITSTFVHNRYKEQTFYDLLAEKARLVKQVSPDWLTGPEIRIYQLGGRL